jgi:hypothetical protein
VLFEEVQQRIAWRSKQVSALLQCGVSSSNAYAAWLLVDVLFALTQQRERPSP